MPCIQILPQRRNRSYQHRSTKQQEQPFSLRRKITTLVQNKQQAQRRYDQRQYPRPIRTLHSQLKIMNCKLCSIFKANNKFQIFGIIQQRKRRIRCPLVWLYLQYRRLNPSTIARTNVNAVFSIRLNHPHQSVFTGRQRKIRTAVQFSILIALCERKCFIIGITKVKAVHFQPFPHPCAAAQTGSPQQKHAKYSGRQNDP